MTDITKETQRIILGSAGFQVPLFLTDFNWVGSNTNPSKPPWLGNITPS